MNYDERISNLTMQLNAASREVIIQDRILGQAREKVAELQGRINMLAELQETFVLEDREKAMKQPGPTAAGRGKQPVPGTRPPGPKPARKIKRERFRYPDGLRNFCIKNIDKMKNQELMEAANKEFDLDMDYMRLMSYLKYNNIRRSKSSSKKKDLPTLPPEDY